MCHVDRLGRGLLDDLPVELAEPVERGAPLYEYAKDTGSGQANGQGVGGKWFVVPPDVAANKKTS